MGTKGLKAVVVDRRGKSAVALADPETFKTAAKAVAKGIKENDFTGKMLKQLGTARLVSILNYMGAFPCFNATKGTLDDYEKISGEAWPK